MRQRPTDHANLDLTQFHLDAIHGRTGGRIIWQPRIIAWLDDRIREGRPLPGKYEGLSLPEIYRSLNCSNRIYDFNECLISHEDPGVKTTVEEDEGGRIEETVETPIGTQRAIHQRSPNSSYLHHIKWPIADEDDMRIAGWREERRTWSWDQKRYEQLCEKWSGLGAPTIYMPRVTVQMLYIDEMGVEDSIFALTDYESTCKAYFDALSVNHERLIEVINESPIEIVNFGDNLHSGTLPPYMFEKYVLPVYQRRCELLHAAGKFVHAHWDGNCRQLLPYAKETTLDGIEAITPVPQGDVTLPETKAGLGEMWLLDGIPAVYFDHTFSERTLIDCAKKCIDLFAPNLVLGISDEMSSMGDIERIRIVGEIVDDYNASL
jgi:hypothetical protein